MGWFRELIVAIVALGIAVVLILVGSHALGSPSTGKCLFGGKPPLYGRVLSISEAKGPTSGNLASKTLTVCGAGSVAPCPQVIPQDHQKVVLTPVSCIPPEDSVGVGQSHTCSMYLMSGKPVVLTLPARTYTPQELVGQLNCLLSKKVPDVQYGPAMNQSVDTPTTPFPAVTCTPDGTTHTLPGSPTPTSCSCAGPGQTCGSEESALASAGATCQSPYLTNASTSTIYRLGGLYSHTCHTQLGLPEPSTVLAPPLPGSILSHIGTTADTVAITACSKTSCTAAPACPVSYPSGEWGQLILTMDPNSFFTPDNVGCGDAIYDKKGANVGRVVAVTATQMTLQEVPLTLTQVTGGTPLFVHRTALYLDHKTPSAQAPVKTFMNHFMRNPSVHTETQYLMHLLYSENLTTDKLEVTEANNTIAIQGQAAVTVPPGSYSPDGKDGLQALINTLMTQNKVPLKMIWKPPSQMLAQLHGNPPPVWYRTAIPQFIYYPQNNSTLKSITVEAGTTCLHVLGLGGPGVPFTPFTVSEQSPQHMAPFLMHNAGEPANVMPGLLKAATTPAPGVVQQVIQQVIQAKTVSTLPGSVMNMCSSGKDYKMQGWLCIGIGSLLVLLVLRPYVSHAYGIAKAKP